MPRKAIAWSGGILVLLWIMSGISRMIPPAPVVGYLDQVSKAIAIDAEAITLGHSHSQAVDFGILGLNGEHLFFPGMDWFEREYLLPRLRQSLPNLRVVFLPISPLDCFHDNGVSQRTYRMEVYLLGRVLGAQSHIDGDLPNALFSRLAWVVRRDHWWGVAQKALGKGNEMPRIWSGPGTESMLSQQDKYAFTRSEVRRLYAQFIQVAEPGSDIPERVLEAVIAIRDTLDRAGIETVVFRSPFPSLTTALLKEEASLNGIDILRTYEDLTRALAAHGIPVLDVSQDPTLSEDFELFKNPSHVNRRGAEVFSRMLTAQLQGARPAAGGSPEAPEASPSG